MKDNDPSFNKGRRDVLLGAVAAGAAATALPSIAYAAKTPMRFDDPEWNRDAYARLVGNMDFGKVKYGWYGGTVMGMRDDEPLKPLMGFEGFSTTRLIDNGDGSYQKLLRETVYYKDLDTGEVLETWLNPYTNEEVNVVPVTNDPFNIVIEKWYPSGPTYGGLREKDKERRPMILPFQIISDDTVALATDIHLYYPSALQPDKWPRESAGKFVRVSEMFRYVISRDQLEDSSVTAIEYTGAWSRVNPWMPWMLMGQAPGNTLYMGSMGAYNHLDMLSPQVRAYAQKHHPMYFDAPTEWKEPSLSSLEDYARTQKPAPLKN
ncbi:MAG: hypothetical protein ACI87W_000634 [Halieaceae bacterium]|jgi:hypothetical protein